MKRMKRRKMQENSLFNHIKNYWVVYAFIVQLIVNYSITNQTLQDFEKRITRLELNSDTEALVVSEINSRLASIETSLIFIREQVK